MLRSSIKSTYDAALRKNLSPLLTAPSYQINNMLHHLHKVTHKAHLQSFYKTSTTPPKKLDGL